MCNWGLRQTAELENQMTSVERVIEYTKVPSERSLESDPQLLKSLPSNWSRTGVIEFKNVGVKYSGEADLVLKNLNFKIHEKVCSFAGIVDLFYIFHNDFEKYMKTPF